jgi:ribosome-associated heat shock protein Hsp15
MSEKLRIDKWLWAARFYKTRALAGKACELGRIVCREQEVKPSREVRVGDVYDIRYEAGETWTVEVLALSGIRGPAAVAQTLYRETEASIAARLQRAEERKVMPRFEDTWGEGKPSKKDRRDLDRVRGRRR